MQVIKVLIVDDNATFLRAAALLMRSLPRVEVTGTAESGLDAITLAQAQRPDLVLMDVNMPLMDGVQAAARMRKQGLMAKIVFVSLGDAPLTLAQMLGVEPDGFVPKGDFAAEVCRVIERLFPQSATCDCGVQS